MPPFDGVIDGLHFNEFQALTGSTCATSRYTYDPRNQLVGFERFAGGSNDVLVKAEYRYDCFNRRIFSVVEEQAYTINGVGTITPDGPPSVSRAASLYGGSPARNYSVPFSTATT